MKRSSLFAPMCIEDNKRQPCLIDDKDKCFETVRDMLSRLTSVGYYAFCVSDRNTPTTISNQILTISSLASSFFVLPSVSIGFLAEENMDAKELYFSCTTLCSIMGLQTTEEGAPQFSTVCSFSEELEKLSLVLSLDFEGEA